MPKSDTDVIEARQEQSQASRRATLDLLRSKKRAEKDLMVQFPGSEDPYSFHLRAIGAKEYDELVSKFPPTIEQRAEGASYDIHRFAPALLSAVITEPRMTETEWLEIWNSPDWNRGEVMQFFYSAVDLCNQGLTIPFSGRA